MLAKLRSNPIVWFLLGAACFYLSQPLIRIPILGALQGTVGFNLFAAAQPALWWLVMGFTAGIAEEVMRYLFKRWLVLPERSHINQPVIFGLGHGLMEAVWLLLPPMMSGYAPFMTLAYVERFLAVIVHMSLTIVVWNGFQINRRMTYLLAAIIVHGLIDSSIGLFHYLQLTPVQVESCIAIYALLLLGYALYSRKYYRSTVAATDTLQGVV